MTQPPNDLTLSILANSQSQPTHALILAKKLAKLASQQGITAQVLTDNQNLSNISTDNHLLITVGEPIVNALCPQQTIDIAAANNLELALQEALTGQPQSAKAFQYSQPAWSAIE